MFNKNRVIIIISTFLIILQLSSLLVKISANSDSLHKQIKKMSLQDKIAQMYFVPSNGDANTIKKDIQQYHLGGIILFSVDFQNQNQNQFKTKINDWQKVSPIPLFIGTDQEGGSVSRLSANPQLTNNRQFPAPMELNTSLTQVVNEAKNTAQILHQLGINWNFAPVADVSSDPQSFIYPRTYGKNYTETATYISKVVPAIQGQKVAATLKHFPGYGTASDTHTGLASSNKALAALQKEDFLPFETGIKAKVDSILVSHVFVTAIDSQYPASLSPKVNHLLRQNLHYNGVIVTDDLSMDAITQFAKEKNINADVQAIKAGNDMILSKNYVTGIKAIETAVKNHEISEKQIDHSVYRILKLKQKLGLIK